MGGTFRNFTVTPDLWRRYMAGLQAVRRGADPAVTLWLVINPTPDIEKASRGKLPSQYRYVA